MFATKAIPGTDHFRVEVSGWDENEMFFVEKSDLAWDEFAGKHVSLVHMLPDGVIIFVRILQPTAIRQAPPVAYQVEFIGCSPEGSHEFRLNPVRPRYSPEPAHLN
jgi:hypothetical protein